MKRKSWKQSNVVPLRQIHWWQPQQRQLVQQPAVPVTVSCMNWRNAMMSWRTRSVYCVVWMFAFSALTLLVGQQEEHLACKNMEWWGRLKWSQMSCIWSRWCHCYPIISCLSIIQNGLFLFRLTHIVLEERLLLLPCCLSFERPRGMSYHVPLVLYETCVTKNTKKLYQP